MLWIYHPAKMTVISTLESNRIKRENKVWISFLSSFCNFFVASNRKRNQKVRWGKKKTMESNTTSLNQRYDPTKRKPNN